jgi:hypothetical protein
VVSARESYRRKFLALFERLIAGDGFTRTGRFFTRSDPSRNQIIIDLQSTAVPGDCATFYINVGILLGIEIDTERPLRSPDWQPSSSSGVWRHRLAPDGWVGTHTWTICSVDEAAAQAQNAYASLCRELPRLLRLMDPDAMLAAAKQERWARSQVVEGYLLAEQGRREEVEALLRTHERDPDDLVHVERLILDLAHARSAGS